MLVPYIVLYLLCVHLLSLLLFYNDCIIGMLFIVGQCVIRTNFNGCLADTPFMCKIQP